MPSILHNHRSFLLRPLNYYWPHPLAVLSLPCNRTFLAGSGGWLQQWNRVTHCRRLSLPQPIHERYWLQCACVNQSGWNLGRGRAPPQHLKCTSEPPAQTPQTTGLWPVYTSSLLLWRPLNSTRPRPLPVQIITVPVRLPVSYTKLRFTNTQPVVGYQNSATATSVYCYAKRQKVCESV